MSNTGQHLRIPCYSNDGHGRDTYISFSNGGFSNYPYSRSYKKDCYDFYVQKRSSDLYQNRPIIKYNRDGNGRDYFIYQNSVSEHNRGNGISSFPNTLRNFNGYSSNKFPYPLATNRFEKNLIGRIFYGNCKGVKDRQMCPKVSFKKNLNIETESTKGPNSQTKKFQKFLSETDLNSYETKDKNSKNIANTEAYYVENKNNNEINQEKKANKSKKPNIKAVKIKESESSEDLLDSVKNIFLFNNRKKFNSIGKFKGIK